MSDFVVSARKYRPSTFESVVGQKALTTTLKNAIEQNKLSHAYLFCGPRGVGKTSCARIFAKTINCQNRTPSGEACNECESCIAANEQRSYNIMELDAASNNSVNDIRQLIDQVYIAPTSGKYRVYIIDEVHMLSSSAFNAFLKTLEEPPAHAIFILATTEKHKVLPTIISRCQVHDFSRITAHDIADHLQWIAQNEGIYTEPEALQMIGIAADGGMRDALSMFDQIAGFGGGRITLQGVRENLNLLDEDEYFKLLYYVTEGSYPKTLTLVNDLLIRGYEGDIIMRGFSAFLRNVLLAQSSETLYLVETPLSIRERMQKAAAYTPAYMLWNYLKVSSSFGAQYKSSGDKRLALEVALMKMCEMNSNSPLATPPSVEPTHPAPTESAKPSAPHPPQQTAIPPTANPQGGVGQMSQPQQVYTRPTTTPKEERKKPPQGSGAQKMFGINIATGKQFGAHKEEDKGGKELNRSEDYSEEDLQRSWRKVTSLVKAPIARQVLERNLPAKSTDHRINIVVQSNTHRQQVLEVMDMILQTLHDDLQNDQIGITIDVDVQQVESGPQTPQEKLAFLTKDNPWLQAMTNDLELYPR
ncbi:DNA polymerase III subunit gamma/tau [Porphyromonas levii]|uniref:DNA polymerase III subunit gamma/tau n=1 Tax=Porphyromonas levii TaxID=28114 RepID=UPI00036FD398|nr:DNA polymerase III subunit gamma/tau [Porphyromonas levii]